MAALFDIAHTPSHEADFQRWLAHDYRPIAGGWQY